MTTPQTAAEEMLDRLARSAEHTAPGSPLEQAAAIVDSLVSGSVPAAA